MLPMGNRPIISMGFDLPLEAVARKRAAQSQAEFVRRAALVVRSTEDVRVHASEDGLRILAANEDSLAGSVAALRRLYADSVDISPPSVRVIEGKPMREPVMTVRISTRRDYTADVRQELQRRGAKILEECSGSRLFIVRGVAPMTELLGLPAALAALTRGSAVHWIRLSHYAPVPPEVEHT